MFDSTAWPMDVTLACFNCEASRNDMVSSGMSVGGWEASQDPEF